MARHSSALSTPSTSVASPRPASTRCCMLAGRRPPSRLPIRVPASTVPTLMKVPVNGIAAKPGRMVRHGRPARLARLHDGPAPRGRRAGRCARASGRQRSDRPRRRPGRRAHARADRPALGARGAPRRRRRRCASTTRGRSSTTRPRPRCCGRGRGRSATTRWPPTTGAGATASGSGHWSAGGWPARRWWSPRRPTCGSRPGSSSRPPSTPPAVASPPTATTPRRGHAT